MNNILCLGDFSSGKSAFLNMLLGVSILPEKLESTNIPIIKIHSDGVGGVYLHEIGEKNPKHIGKWSNIPEDWSSFEYVELIIPNHPLLDKGLILWDSPGINSTNNHHTNHVESFLKRNQSQFNSILFFISEQILLTHIKYIQQWKQLQSRMRIVVNIRKEMSERDARKIESHVKKEVGIQLGTIPVELLYLWDAYNEFDDQSYEKQGKINEQARLAMWEELVVDFDELKKKHEDKIIGDVIFDILKDETAIVMSDDIFSDRLGIKWILVEGLAGRDYFISATQVTFAQYEEFCNKTGYRNPNADFGRGKQPVINVNVDDANAFCNWISKETDAKIRLPEENEWEYAAYGGNKRINSEFSGSNFIDEVAWWGRNSINRPHEVATKKSNSLGIYDMSGNVWEWCGQKGAIRGGSWINDSISCRIVARYDCDPNIRLNDLGFRILKIL